MAAKSKLVKGLKPRTPAVALEQAAIGKRVNRTGGRTSMVSQLSGKTEEELQTIIRVIKNKKSPNAQEIAKMAEAKKLLKTKSFGEAGEFDKSLRKMQQGAADKKAKPVSLPEMKKGTPDRAMSQGGLTQPTKNQTGLKKLPTAVRNKMGYFKSGGMAPSGNNDMRKSGMFK